MLELFAMLVFILRVSLLGLCWVRPAMLCRMPPVDKARRSDVYAAAAALLAGLVLNLLLVLGLGLWGRYQPLAEAAGFIALCSLGLILGAKAHHAAASACRMLGILAAVWILVSGLLSAVAPASEWVRGGWDPGVYINEGLALERTGTFHPPDPVFHEVLDEEGRWVFTRTGQGRTERFPGVLVDARREAFGFEFFRLMPSATALAARSGGAAGALGLNLALAGLALLLLTSLLAVQAGWRHALFGALMLALQPLWIYHSHTPVSEMLQLCLVLGMGLVMPERHTSAFARLLLAALLFAAVLNRFSFLPFGALLTAWCAYEAMEHHDRKVSFRVLLVCSGGLYAAALIDAAIAPSSLLNWARWGMLAMIAGAAFAATLGAAVLLAAGRRLRLLTARVFSQPWLCSGCVVAALATLSAMWVCGRFAGGGKDIDNVYRLAPYLGYAPLALAALGGLAVYARPQVRREPWFIFGLFLLSVTALLLLRKNIIDWYPWATRRYLPYTVPLVALLAAQIPTRLMRPPFRFFGLATALAAVTLFLQAPLCRDAARCTEFTGWTQRLQTMAPGDEVLVVDDPRWGTAFALAQGREVLNGKHLWRTPEKASKAAVALDRLVQAGYTVQFLTSTEEGAELFPPVIGNRLVPVAAVDRFPYREVIHHPKAKGFQLRDREAWFRRYAWTGPDGRAEEEGRDAREGPTSLPGTE